MTSRPRQPARKISGAKPAETVSVRESGRHPDAERTVVRFTDAAVADLEQMIRTGDPQVVRWALKKCLLLERNPEAGEGLRGALIGFRKLTVGDRDWRVVWRVTHDDDGRLVVDVAEVWAMGARSDSEVYDEMRDRVATLSKNPKTLPLAAVIERLGKVAAGSSPKYVEPVKGPFASSPTPQPDAAAEVPTWLVQALVKVAGMPAAEVAKLSADEAERRWLEHISAPR